MNTLKYTTHIKQSFPLQELYLLYQKKLQLKILNKTFLKHQSLEAKNPYPHRPSLVFSGFFHLFPISKLQIIGNIEWNYLNTLSETERKTSL